jgi:hypothetical protein
MEVIHVTASRIRLRYGDGWTDAHRDALVTALQAQSWVDCVHSRPLARSVVLELRPGCPEVRWQLALAAQGVQLIDPPGLADPSTDDETQPDGRWEWMVRQIGGNLMGAAIGQILLGGTAGLVGAWLFGNRAGLILGSTGAVLGTVIGAVAGGELVEGKSPLLEGQLGPGILRRLGGRLGEEAGASTGALVGAALAGPAGAFAGMTIGSFVAGQALEDLLSARHQDTGIGRLRWLVKTGENRSAESVTEALMSSLGRSLSGGEEWGARLGSTVGGNVGSKIDWATSWSRHHFVHNRS